MAKQLSHFFSFKSRGTAGGGVHEFLVEIFTEGFVGDPEELTAGGNPLSISYNKDMGNNFVGGMVPSVVTIEAVSNENFYASIFLSEKYGDVHITVTRDPDTPNETIEFKGIVVPFESADLDRETKLYTVTLTAECGLSYLKNVPYVSNTEGTTKKRLLEIFKQCIDAISDLTGGYEGFKIYDQTQAFLESGPPDPTPRNWGYWELFINETNFDGLSCWEVIEAIIQPYSEVFLEQNLWNIRNVPDLGNYSISAVTNSLLRIVDYSLSSTTLITEYPRPTSSVQRTAGGFFGHIFTDKRITVQKHASAPRNAGGDFGEFNDLTGWEFYVNPIAQTVPIPGTNQVAFLTPDSPPYGVLSDFFEIYNGYLRNKQVNQLWIMDKWGTGGAAYEPKKRARPRLVSPTFFYNPYRRMNPDNSGSYEPTEGVRVSLRAIFGDNISHLNVGILVIGPMQDEKPFISFLKEDGSWKSYQVDDDVDIFKGYNDYMAIARPTDDADIIHINIPPPPTPTQSRKKKFLWWRKEQDLLWDRVDGGVYYDDPTTNVDNLLAFSPVYQVRVIIHLPTKPTADLTVPGSLNASTEDDRLYIDWIRIAEISNDPEVVEGFAKTYVNEANQIVERTENTVIDLRVGFPSETGNDALYSEENDDTKMIMTYNHAGMFYLVDSLPIDKHLAVNYLGISSNNRLKTYQGVVLGDLTFGSLVDIDGQPYRIHNYSRNYKTNETSIKLIENHFEGITVVEPEYISIFDEDRLPVSVRYNLSGVRIIGPNVSFQGYGSAISAENSAGGGGSVTNQGTYVLSSDPVYDSVTSNSYATVSPDGEGLVIDITEETDQVWTLIKPAEDGTYATREWSKKNLWTVAGNESEASSLIFGTLTETDIDIYSHGSVFGRITDSTYILGDVSLVTDMGQTLTVVGSIRQTGALNSMLKSDTFGTIVSAEVDVDYLSPATAASRYLRKDQNDSNSTFKLTLGELQAGNSLLTGTVTMNFLTEATTEEDILVITGTGLVKYRSLSSFGGILINDKDNVNQFEVNLGGSLLFEGTGDTSITFNPITGKIVINSVPGSGTGGVVTSVFGRTGGVVAEPGDYNTLQVVENPANLYFTQARVLATPLTGYLVGANSPIAATDTLLQMAGKIQGQLNAKQNTISINTARLMGRYSAGVGTYQEITLGAGLSLSGSGVLSASGTGGTVTTFSAGSLSPLFTTNVATPTTTPALTFTLSNAAAYTVFGRAAGTGAPSYLSLSVDHIPGLPASKITSGVLATARLGSGTPAAGTYVDGATGAWTALPTPPTMQTLTRGTGLTGSNYNGSAATTWAFDTVFGDARYALKAEIPSLAGYVLKAGDTMSGPLNFTSVNMLRYGGVNKFRVGGLDGYKSTVISAEGEIIYLRSQGDTATGTGEVIIASSTFTYGGNAIYHAGNFPTLKPDLEAIEVLSGTAGLLRKTAANTWSLDTSTYLTAASLSNYVTVNTQQDITGVKTFTAGAVNVGNTGASYFSIRIGNSAVTSGLGNVIYLHNATFDGTRYGTLSTHDDSNTHISSIWANATHARVRIGTTSYNIATEAWVTAQGFGGGTVTTFSAGALTPLFTTNVATATTTPALTFTLSNAAAYTVFGRAAGTGVPSYLSLSVDHIPGLPASKITSGVLATARLGSGTASGTTFLAGDSTWKSVPGGALTATYIGYGDGSNILTGSAGFRFLSSRYIDITAGSGTLAVGVVGSSTNVFLQSVSGNLLLQTGGAYRTIVEDGIFRVNGLAGGTTRFVQVNSSGDLVATLSTITATLTNKQIGVGNVSNQLSGVPFLTFEDSRYINIVSGGGVFATGVAGSDGFVQALNANLLLQANSGYSVVVDTGGFRVDSLSGVGTRMVVVDSSGNFGSQAISGGSLTDTYVAFGSPSNLITGSSNFRFRESRYVNIVNGSVGLATGVHAGLGIGFLESTGGPLWLQAGSGSIVAKSSLMIEPLGGSGTRMLTVDNSGNVGAQAIPGGGGSLPVNQVAFGTGSGITGSSNFQYDLYSLTLLNGANISSLSPADIGFWTGSLNQRREIYTSYNPGGGVSRISLGMKPDNAYALDVDFDFDMSTLNPWGTINTGDRVIFECVTKSGGGMTFRLVKV